MTRRWKEPKGWIYFCEELNVLVIGFPEYEDPHQRGMPVEWDAKDMWEVQSKNNFSEVFTRYTWTYVGDL